jgi:isocitrate dehydrogenase
MGWNEAADLIIESMEKSILEGNVTYDLARGRNDASILSSSEFAESLVKNIQ